MADVLLLGFFGALILGGWTTGFVRRLAGLLFMAASFVLGAYLRAPIGAIVVSIFPDIPKAYAEMIGYAIGSTVLIFLFNLLSGAVLSKVAVQGLSKVTDKALGAVLGAVEAALIASAAIVILHTYSSEVAALANLGGFGLLKDIAAGIDSSTIGKLLTSTTVPVVLAILGPLLPSDITSLVPTTIPGLPGGSLPKLP
jgi:uncharacterized membrane protein required for colicin V production